MIFAIVPHVQHLAVRQAADQTRVDQAGIADARHMARAREHAFEIPDGFLGFREMLRQEPAAILLGEKAIEAPEHFFLGADVENIDDQ